MSEIIRSRQIETSHCEGLLMRAITNSHFKRRDVVWAYRIAVNSDQTIDWEKIHNAIVERWSHFAVEWIRRQASKHGAADATRAEGGGE